MGFERTKFIVEDIQRRRSKRNSPKKIKRLRKERLTEEDLKTTHQTK